MNTLAARQALESKLQEVTNPAGWRDCIAVCPSADPTDTTQQIVEREMASRSLNRNASLVRDLRAAMGRLEEGAYGLCIDCDEPISSRRLAAVPWAARCISCQHNLETGGTQVEALAA